MAFAASCIVAFCCVTTHALDCWSGDFTSATCCDTIHGPSGNPSCWDGVYTYDKCCKKRRAPQPQQKAKEQGKASSKPKLVQKEEKNAVVVAQRRNQAIDGVVVGIDLGTTYSAVAIFRNGRAEVIANDQGNRITPSVVSFLPSGERLVGEAAKNVMSDYPKSTIFDAKRLVGRGFNDRSVQIDRKSFPFRIVDRRGRPHIEVEKASKGSLILAPEEVSAMVLTKMKAIAEAHLGEEVRHAVVTVPAYFTDNQRSATKIAGEIAGLNIARIINEPTAAAIAYGFENKRPKTGRTEAHLLVYDLCGGTFDVSLLCIDNGVFEVLATNGNTRLGGEDFDRNIVKYLAEQFKAKSGKDPARDRRAMQKLKVAAEEAKRTLSTKVRATIEIEALFQGVDFSHSLSRSKFEQLNSELFYKTLEPVKRVLEDAKLNVQDIDEVVLIGGSTRIPKIQLLIKEFFKLTKHPQHKVNPDEAVAVGAAIQGELLWRGSAPGQALVVGSRKSWDIVLVDVTPLSLGIEINAGHMAVIVPRNTALPTMRTQTFTTVHDHQTTVSIPIYQGEHNVAAKNNRLGHMVLSGIPPAPVGVPQVDVTFRIDANGILHVTAKDKGTDAAASVTISSSNGRLSDEEIEKMIRSAQRQAEEDRQMLMRNDARAALQAYVDSLRSSLLNSGNLLEDDRSVLEVAIDDASEWLKASGDSSLEELQEQKSNLEDIANPIIAKIYGQAAPAVHESEDEESDEVVEDANIWDDDVEL